MGVGREISCAGVRARLPLLPGDELQGGVDGAVRAHLRRCHACQRELSTYVAAGAALREVAAEPVVGPDFFVALRASVLEAVGREPTPRSSRWRGLRRRAAVAAVLVAAGLAFAWVGLGWLDLRSTETPGAGLLRQPGLAQSRAPSTAPHSMVVPVSFSPQTQGLRGLQRLDLDPRWSDRPRSGR